MKKTLHVLTLENKRNTLYMLMLTRINYLLYNVRGDPKCNNVPTCCETNEPGIINEANGISFVINIMHYEIAKLN